MKGHTPDYPYEPLTGLNPFEEQLRSDAKTLQWQAENIAQLAKLHAYFAAFPAVTSDDVKSISVCGSNLTFNLDVPDSRFCHALAQFTGLTFEKRRAYSGEALRLVTKSIPEEHPLAQLGITSLAVGGAALRQQLSSRG